MRKYRVVIYQDGLRTGAQEYNTLEGAKACYFRETPACRDDPKRGVMLEARGLDGWEILTAYTKAGDK